MSDTDILDAEFMLGQKRYNMGQGAGLVGNVHADAVRAFDGAAGDVDKRIPVETCVFETVVKGRLFFRVPIFFKGAQNPDIVGKQSRKIRSVG